MTEEIFPVGRLVLVRKHDVEDTFGNDIKFYKPAETKDTDHHRQATGTVVRVSKQAFVDVYPEQQCKEGDNVIFRAYGGTQASNSDKNLILLKDEDVLAVVVKVPEDEEND